MNQEIKEKRDYQETIKYIRNKMRYYNITVKHMCKLLGITTATFYNWCSLATQPTYGQIITMCYILNINIEISNIKDTKSISIGHEK